MPTLGWILEDDCGYIADIIVEDQVIVELKSVEHAEPLHEASVTSFNSFRDTAFSPCARKVHPPSSNLADQWRRASSAVAMPVLLKSSPI